MAIENLATPLNLQNFRDAAQLEGNLQLSGNASSPGIVQAGKTAWIKSALDLGGARKANADILNALKTALAKNARYSGTPMQQIQALLREVRTDRPLTGAKIRVLLEKADAFAEQAEQTQAANELLNLSTNPQNALRFAKNAIGNNLQARCRENPGQEALLNHPSVCSQNDRDVQFVLNLARERFAAVDRNGALKTPKAKLDFFKDALNAAVDGLVQRRLVIVSAGDVEPRLKAALLNGLQDPSTGGFSDLDEQLKEARQTSAQNAAQRQANLALADGLTKPEDLQAALSGKGVSLSDTELEVFRDALKEKILGDANRSSNVRELSPDEARASQEEFMGRIVETLKSDAWAKTEAFRESRPLECAYLRKQMLQGEKIPAALVEALPKVSDDLQARIFGTDGSALRARLAGNDGTPTPLRLHQALLELHTAFVETFAALPEAARSEAERQPEFVRFTAEALVAARLEAQHPGISREFSAALLTNGASRALRTFIEYHAQSGDAQDHVQEFQKTYEEIAQAMSRQAGISDADFERAWNDVPLAASRLELPADTQALPVWDASGRLGNPPVSTGNIPFAPLDDPREKLQNILFGDMLPNEMMKAAAREGGYGNLDMLSQFAKDANRSTQVRLDGVKMSNGNLDMLASSPQSRANASYSHVLRFINPEATLATATQEELAQMHALAGIFNQSAMLSLNIQKLPGEKVLGMLSENEIQSFSADRVGENIVLRIEFNIALSSITDHQDGSFVSLDKNSRQAHLAVITLPRVELARFAAQDWARAARSGTDSRSLSEEFRLNIPNDRIQIHSVMVLNAAQPDETTQDSAS
jgi:hypothetical protein